MTSQPTKSSPPLPRSKFAFWQILFIYFWVFSLAGHYLELMWAPISAWISKTPLWQPTTYTILPLAPPYGLGVVAIILLIIPLAKRYDLRVSGTFILSTIVTGVVEYICATILVWLFGSNIYWDYSHRPFNLQGRICLENCLLFGLAATFFIYLIYPFCEKLINKLTQKRINLIFWTMFISYGLDWLMIALTDHQSKIIFDQFIERKNSLIIKSPPSAN